jgi:hypothetical protein
LFGTKKAEKKFNQSVFDEELDFASAPATIPAALPVDPVPIAVPLVRERPPSAAKSAVVNTQTGLSFGTSQAGAAVVEVEAEVEVETQYAGNQLEEEVVLDGRTAGSSGGAGAGTDANANSGNMAAAKKAGADDVEVEVYVGSPTAVPVGGNDSVNNTSVAAAETTTELADDFASVSLVEE